MNERKKVTFIGLQSATTQMMDSLVRYEEMIGSILEKAIFLAPTMFLNLPGPSFTDPVMN